MRASEALGMFLRSSWIVVLGLVATAPAQQVLIDSREVSMPLLMAETRGLFVGDIDGDGLTDLAVGNAGGGMRYPHNSSHVLINQGHGRFVNTTAPDVVGRLYLDLVDLDRDNDLDLAFFDNMASAGGIAVNDGAGRFTFLNNRFSAANVLATGDVDGDGWIDLFTGTKLYLNQGGLVFTDVSTSHLPALGSVDPSAVEIGDYDADGDLDLLIGDGNGQNLLLDNDGQGRFTDVTAARLPAGIDPTRALLIEDLDGDGYLDLIVGNWGQRLMIYLNDGAGRFTLGGNAGSSPRNVLALAGGDVDGDGDVDVAIGLEIGGALLLNRGNAIFDWTPDWDAGRQSTTAVVLVDVDADLDLDLVQGCGREPMRFNPSGQPAGIENRVFFNASDARFEAPGGRAIPDSFDDSFAVAGDLDADGDLDLFYAGDGGCVWWNDGWGAFQRLDLNLPIAGEPSLGDLDGDGDLDVILLETVGVFHVLDNPGNGQIWPLRSFWLSRLPTGATSEAAALGDLDGDGDLDVFVATLGQMFGMPSTCPDSLWLNDGTGDFSSAQHLLPTGAATRATGVAIGDLDLDGDLDVVTSGGLIYYNLGGAGFVGVTLGVAGNYGESHIALADLDADGYLDLVAGNACRWMGCAPSGAGGPNSVHWNDGSGGLGNGQILASSSDTFTVAVAIDDFDGDGDLDLVYGNLGVPGSGHDNSPLNLLYRNDGARNLVRVAEDEFPFDFDDTVDLAAGDFDGDGDADLIVCNAAVDPGESPRVNLYSGLARHLRAPFAARLGHPLVFEVYGADLGAVLLLALGPGSTALPPYGQLGLDPVSTAILAVLPPPATGSRAVFQLPLPRIPALAGVRIYLQALAMTAAAGGSRFTNRLSEVLSSH